MWEIYEDGKWIKLESSRYYKEMTVDKAITSMYGEDYEKDNIDITHAANFDWLQSGQRTSWGSSNASPNSVGTGRMFRVLRQWKDWYRKGIETLPPL